MDILSHALYGGVAFGRKSKRNYLIAFLFGLGPDLLSFGLFFMSNLFGSISGPNNGFGPPDLASIPDTVYLLYDITHSLIVYLVFFALLWWLGKRDFAKLTLAWPLHILVDIPTHSSAFFPTPFLWPVSDFSINGLSWGQPMIFIPNVIILFCLYLYWYIKKRNQKIKPLPQV